MALKWKSKVLLAKVEATYGTDPTPTGALNAILATEVRLTPMEGQDVGRELELPWLGAQGSIPTGLHQRLSFRVEMTPSGEAGTPPAWGVLLRACAVAETITADTSVEYNPVTDGHESITLYLWIASTLYKISGARGTAVIRVTAQGIVYLEVDLTGLFSLPSETPQATPALAAQIALKPEVATTANTPVFTINGTPLVMRSFALNLGNQVETRFLIGSESVLIPDKMETIETTVEAVPLTTLNPFQLAYSQTTGAVALTHGTAAGRIASLAIPAAQMQRPQSLENQQNIKEWPLRMVPLPTAGNDQWTLTLT
ncbi:phage tail tube protein [Frigidibacter oleivorans]|uniref:phage tail tube protein n=1 Tax=Frigidibacter oleivorans TaxID=2487129 RepID=UPI000F8D5CA5|nr:phage tail tube protein [Frigidibacter oleivorans]